MSMEFYSEARVRAKKEHTCEMCGRKIKPGEIYYRENGKWCGDFFSRALHSQCHLMEEDYCCEVDCEFSWDGIQDHIQDEYCCVCEHAAGNDDKEGWTDCTHSVTDCPIILKRLCEKYGRLEENTQ